MNYFPGRVLQLFKRGQDEEDRFIKDLREIGVRTWSVDPDTGKQFHVEWLGGHFSGSCDGIAEGLIEGPLTRSLLEFKTHGDKSFKDLCHKGLKESKPVHWDQCQIYMHGLGLTRAYYMAVNKNDDSLYGERIEYDKEDAEAILDKARMIIEANTPPARISEKPDWYQC